MLNHLDKVGLHPFSFATDFDTLIHVDDGVMQSPWQLLGLTNSSCQPGNLSLPARAESVWNMICLLARYFMLKGVQSRLKKEKLRTKNLRRVELENRYCNLNTESLRRKKLNTGSLRP